MDAMPLPITLGEFRCEAILGHGGSGIVYDAVWGPRRVALKVLHASLADTQRVRAQFLTEAQRLQAIAHPSVVKVLACGELPDGRPYLAMERLEGETLASVLARGALPLTQALALFGELCGAVGTLHEQGLIHRDLKPENVYIVDGKHAVLLDFGIAKELAAPASTTTMDGGVRGTPAYMAPERFFGQPAAVSTDIYELAVTLYAMLAGRLPWDDLADPEARLSPRPLVELAQVPEELDVEIRRALSTRAQNRPATAGALLEAVRTTAGAVAPTAAETARMRPQTGEQAAQPKATTTGERTPWFAERQNTTDRGKTPLAWAPTEMAVATAPVRSRKWPIVVGVVTFAGLAGSAVWWRMHRSQASPSDAAVPSAAPPLAPVAVLEATQDPWGSTAPPRAVAPLHVAGPELTAAAAQAEVAAAVPHLPIDTTVVASVLVGHLKRDDRFSPLFDKLGKNPQAAVLMGMLPPCVKQLVSQAEWFVFGSDDFQSGQHGTLIIRGRWDRQDVEGCFFGQTEELKLADGAKLLQLPAVGWVDFLDDHTAYVSVRQDLAAAQVHDNVTHAKGLTPHARELVARAPANHALLFVVDGANGARWTNDVLPRGTDMTTWLRTDPAWVSFDVRMKLEKEADAKALETTLHAQVDGVFKTASPAVGTLDIARKGSTVQLDGKVSSLMMGIVSAAIP